MFATAQVAENGVYVPGKYILSFAIFAFAITTLFGWFYYGEQRLGQGRENVKLLFKQETELANEIDQQIRAKMKEALEAKKGAPALAQQPELVKVPITKAAARAKLDIAVDDDE